MVCYRFRRRSRLDRLLERKPPFPRWARFAFRLPPHAERLTVINPPAAACGFGCNHRRYDSRYLPAFSDPELWRRGTICQPSDSRASPRRQRAIGMTSTSGRLETPREANHFGDRGLVVGCEILASRPGRQLLCGSTRPSATGLKAATTTATRDDVRLQFRQTGAYLVDIHYDRIV